MIGVIGGVGPYAGVDLVSKILDNTIACSDQEHIPLLLLSMPDQVTDRTAYLEGKTPVNPGVELAQLTQLAVNAGARAIGIPCNTAHAPAIFNHVAQVVTESEKEVVLLNMIEQVIRFLKLEHPDVRTVGIMSSSGTYKAALYQKAMAHVGIEAIRPDWLTQSTCVHPAIYAAYGIKSVSRPITDRAATDIRNVARDLIAKGAGAIVLGCTELSLAFPGEIQFQGVPLVDSTLILARALIHHTNPEKLRDLSVKTLELNE